VALGLGSGVTLSLGLSLALGLRLGAGLELGLGSGVGLWLAPRLGLALGLGAGLALAENHSSDPMSTTPAGGGAVVELDTAVALVVVLLTALTAKRMAVMP
jgi:hypothetical protein